MRRRTLMNVCKSCNKLIDFRDNIETEYLLDNGLPYHKACYKSKMDTTNYSDPKMDAENYPVQYTAPRKKETKDDQIMNIYGVLGGDKATVWMQQNIYDDVDMADIFHKIMEGEIDYDE